MKGNQNLTGTVATDASWCPKTKICSFAILIQRDQEKPVLKSGVINKNIDSSQRAEEWAIRKGISEARCLGINSITIRSDCLSAIKKFRSKIYPDTANVRFRHIKAHSSNTDLYSIMNRVCDKEARRILRSTRGKFDGDSKYLRIQRKVQSNGNPTIWYPGKKLLR